jgi:heptosyltransferase-1
LLHATSAERKLWPEARWVELGRGLAARNLVCILPWGSPAEQQRSQRLAQQIPQAVVPERLELEVLSALLAQASVVIGTDTGLTHLAGALGVPTIGIYCATDPAATGLYACARASHLGGIGVMPEVAAVTAAMDGLLQ